MTLVETVVIFSAPSMLVYVSWHHRSKKYNTGRERAQRFVAIWFLHRVSRQLNATRIVAMIILQLCQTAARHFEASFHVERTNWTP